MAPHAAPSIRYDVPRPRVGRVTLARPQARNAQDTRLLYELNEAFDRAAQDDAISVIVLAADGPHFSAGHDLRESPEDSAMGQYPTVGTWCGFGCEGAERQMAREKEIYLGFSERWRNIPKPTIAQVQGKAISGGLMLAWPCDLIVASDDAEFIDNTVLMGVPGAEFFQHAYEVGVRKAKEMLFTAQAVTAAEALTLGMVNQVVAVDQLETTVLDLAENIARKPLFGLKLAKEAVNAAQDAQGRAGAMSTAFAMHQLAHTHNLLVHGSLIDPSFGRPGAANEGNVQ